MKISSIKDHLNTYFTFENNEMYFEFLDECAKEGIRWSDGGELGEKYPIESDLLKSRVVQHDGMWRSIRQHGTIPFEGWIPKIKNVE